MAQLNPDEPDLPIAVRYLELLKRALAFTLWPEPLQPAISRNESRGLLKRLVIWLADAALHRMGFVLCKRASISEKDRIEGRVWRSYPDTLIGLKRLDHLQRCVEKVIAESIPGDLIEAGAWRGGACIFMRGVLAAHSVTDRRVFVADSFQGLPPPDLEKYPADARDQHYLATDLAVDIGSVRANFIRYGLLDGQVVFLQGWFKDTLPSAPIVRLAILRLDGDMYGSTMDALTSLYPKLSPGGFCIVDDYALSGCKRAVDDYRHTCAIAAPLEVIDWTGRFWRK